MQITVELDSQHLDKLRALETSLKINTSELIALAIDEVCTKNTANSDAQNAYQLMQQSGFIGCLEDDGNLSENYKDYLDWSPKV